MSDSSTGGYLQPTNPQESRDDIEDIIHDALVGITGLPKDMVRPKWPKEEVSIPEAGVNWCAFGIPERGDSTLPGTTHYGAEDGYNVVAVHEPFAVLASFYGDDAYVYANKLRVGIALAQNREQLYLHGIALEDCGPGIHIPEVVGQVWNDRWDVRLVFRRCVANAYAVLNLKTISTSVQNDTGLEVHN